MTKRFEFWELKFWIYLIFVILDLVLKKLLAASATARFFKFGDFFDATEMPRLTGKFGLKPNGNYFFRSRGRHLPAGKAEYIRVVMFAGKFGEFRSRGIYRAHARHFIGGNANALGRTAE